METKNYAWVWVLLAVVIIGGGVYLFMNKDAMGNEEVATPVATSTPNNPAAVPPGVPVATDGLYGYANAEHNFTMRFTPDVQTTNSFSPFYMLGNSWRYSPSTANQGKPVVTFTIKKIDQGSVATGKAYPLFFTSEVRVGVSPNTKLCYETDSGYTNQKVTDVIINGVTFKKFTFGDAATMKYVQGESYRTIHDNRCYVLEQIKAGSTYRDDTMTSRVSELALTGYYNVGEQIIKTFKFTK